MSGDEQVIRAIEQLEARRYRATVAKDFDELESLFHPKLSYVHSTGVADTRTSYLDGLRNGTWDYHEIRSVEARHTVAGDCVLQFCRLAIRITVKGQYKAFETRQLIVWHRSEAAGWQIIGVQSAAVG